MKLFRSRKSPHRWYAHSAATGWVTFPVQSEGWARRTPARGIDPIDIRLLNAFEEGSSSPTGQKLHSVVAKESILRAAKRFGWNGMDKGNGTGVKA